jgi:predicted dehydrogenase
MFDLDRGDDQLDHCFGKPRDKAEWTTEQLAPTPGNIERFLRAISTGKPHPPDLLRGAQIHAYLDACERSAKAGRWEKVEPV